MPLLTESGSWFAVRVKRCRLRMISSQRLAQEPLRAPPAGDLYLMDASRLTPARGWRSRQKYCARLRKRSALWTGLYVAGMGAAASKRGQGAAGIAEPYQRLTPVLTIEREPGGEHEAGSEADHQGRSPQVPTTACGLPLPLDM